MTIPDSIPSNLNKNITDAMFAFQKSTKDERERLEDVKVFWCPSCKQRLFEDQGSIHCEKCNWRGWIRNLLTPESIKIWENALIASYEANGWKIIQDDEDSLCFSFLEDEDHEWLHDWRRKGRYWIKMNGRQKINLFCRDE